MYSVQVRSSVLPLLLSDLLGSFLGAAPLEDYSSGHPSVEESLITETFEVRRGQAYSCGGFFGSTR